MRRIRPFSRGALIWALALFLAASANYRFFSQTLAVYPLEEHWPFLLSAAAVLVCVFACLAALLSLIAPVRAVAAVLLLVAAGAGHFTDTLGVVIDKAMIRNMLRTDAGEAGDLLSLGLALRVALLGIAPAVLIWLAPLKPVSLLRRQAGLAGVAVGALAGVVALMAPQTDAYASFFREHKPLRYYTTPTYPIYSAVAYAVAADPTEAAPFETRVASAEISSGDREAELVVVVVGETARADHLGINGYARPTTPNLSARTDVVSFTDMRSCGTSTAVSVPCMFSFDGRGDFDADRADRTENVLDALAKAGVSVLWRDNNSGSQGVADRVRYERFDTAERNPACDAVECRDVGMLDGLDAYIEQQPGDVLIVLHQMGSHGPAYFKRYPEAYRRFTPDCRSADLSECTGEEIVNAYDNTILYTDQFLAQVIRFLEGYQDRYETAMLYLSDHGESLGEMGVYLHGLPYSFAPEGQTRVPFIVWAGAGSDLDHAQLKARRGETVTHDDFNRMLLSAFEVRLDGASTPVVSEVLPRKRDDDG